MLPGTLGHDRGCRIRTSIPCDEPVSRNRRLRSIIHPPFFLDSLKTPDRGGKPACLGFCASAALRLQ